MISEKLVTAAVKFAAEAHGGQVRKGSSLPYIIHAMEAATICATFTEDDEVLAAAVLHDVVEDAGVKVDQLINLFGPHVAQIVAGESEDKREGIPPSETWKIRKEESIAHLRSAKDPAVRMVCLGDKLSNIRAIHRDYDKLGEALWDRFNQKNPAEHAWYYSTIADVLSGELGDTDAWREYSSHVKAVFSRYSEQE